MRTVWRSGHALRHNAADKVLERVTDDWRFAPGDLYLAHADCRRVRRIPGASLRRSWRTLRATLRILLRILYRAVYCAASCHLRQVGTWNLS